MYEGLCALSHKESDMQFEDYRLLRLRETVAYAAKESPWYKKRLPETEINCIEDLRKLPFTEPNDIAVGGYQFLCTSLSEVEKPVTFVSSGTTGPRKSVYFSHKDVEAITDFLGMAMHSVAPQ